MNYVQVSMERFLLPFCHGIYQAVSLLIVSGDLLLDKLKCTFFGFFVVISKPARRLKEKNYGNFLPGARGFFGITIII